MKALFQDILSRIEEPPLWWDTNGVPRYDKFHPSMSPNIYATEVVLVEISCQSCQKTFMVEMDWHRSLLCYGFSHCMDVFLATGDNEWLNEFNYGDPPCHNYDDNRCAGEVMVCDDIRIMEFWQKDKKHEWKRVPKYEIYLTD